PRRVAEVALELPDYRRDGERGKARAAVGVVTFDRLDQRDARDLPQVVFGLGRAREAPRKAVGERQKTPDEHVSRFAVRRLSVTPEQGRGRKALGRPGRSVRSLHYVACPCHDAGRARHLEPPACPGWIVLRERSSRDLAGYGGTAKRALRARL